MRTTSRAALVFLLLLLPSLPARAAELTAFLAVAKPGENWAGGAGGAFGINFLQVLHFEAEVAHLPGEILDQYLDATRLRELTGWAPAVDLRTGLGRTVEWYREHEEVRP